MDAEGLAREGCRSGDGGVYCVLAKTLDSLDVSIKIQLTVASVASPEVWSLAVPSNPTTLSKLLFKKSCIGQRGAAGELRAETGPCA